MVEGNWYISITAVREYMAIAGLSGPLEDDNIDYLKAQADLIAFSQSARLVEGAKTLGESQIYRIKHKIHGAPHRLEFTVIPGPSKEGPLPQLVRVRDKGR